MSRKERLDDILSLLKKNGFMTVKALVDEVCFSTATINRDLNVLQNQNIVKRIYGGVELVENRDIPLYFRYSKMRPIKNKIGKKAAEFIKDGDTIFIDCSTTAQYIGKYITDRKNLTVITNNITLAAFLSEHNICVFCLGGKIMEPPSMTYSSDTVEMARKFKADKLFFSAGLATACGKIGKSEYDEHYLTIRTMMENSKERYLLLDHGKLKNEPKQYLGDFSEVDAVITDFVFEEKTLKKYEDTKFITV